MDEAAQRPGRFAVYAWLVLGYNLLVILWGAVVRATGSGAGCGEHWPLCQGVVIPHGAEIATLIEFAHRATSGVAVALVVGLVYFGFRSFAGGHPVRRYALAALGFTLTEGLIGAALVLFGWTGNNASAARVGALSVHLANTFMLLAALALTARAAGRLGLTAVRPGLAARGRLAYGAALVGTLVLAITGTVAALADTLYPATSLAQGLRWDFSGSAHPILRLRVIHPVLAIIVAVLLLVLALDALSAPASAAARRLARFLLVLVAVQVALGVLNLALLAPLATQVLHLLAADLVWITLVLLAAEVLAARPARLAERSRLQMAAAVAPVAPSTASK